MDALSPAFDPADDVITPADVDTRPAPSLTHLEQLEAESVHIIREAVAESENPVMLYSIGKDSSVLLHLALKAFYPAKPPFPLLHVDTTWKFREMIAFRDARTRELGLDLIVHVNQDGLSRGINPVTSGSELHTDVMKTQALRQALDHYRFDAAFGGARRDEEKLRAKERVFSFRNANHLWNPKRQRAEPWRIYNGRKRRGESIRVFPLSNWTELDVWFYIHQERIPVVPLYFAAPRPVVERDGMLVMVDDERLPLEPGERPQIKTVRFRTLGCYPLTGAIESNARAVPEIIRENAGEPLFRAPRARHRPRRLSVNGAKKAGRLFLMNAQAQVADFEFATLLQRQARTSLLRFIACGSVDHGKSTLIGRLLYRSNCSMISSPLSPRNRASSGRRVASSIFRCCWTASPPNASRK